MVSRLTFIPSCCQRWFWIWKRERPSLCRWIALAISWLRQLNKKFQPSFPLHSLKITQIELTDDFS